jgi:hypothetical protein
VDRFIARCRFRATLSHIKPQSSVCDVGFGLDGAFLTSAGDGASFYEFELSSAERRSAGSIASSINRKPHS